MVVNDKLIYYNDHFNRVYKYQIIMLFTGNNMLYVKYTPIKKKNLKKEHWGARLAQLLGNATLDLGVVISSPTLAIEHNFKK